MERGLPQRQPQVGVQRIHRARLTDKEGVPIQIDGEHGAGRQVFGDDLPTDEGLDGVLDIPTEGTGAEGGVVALGYDEVLGRLGHFHPNLLVLQALDSGR